MTPTRRLLPALLLIAAPLSAQNAQTTPQTQTVLTPSTVAWGYDSFHTKPALTRF